MLLSVVHQMPLNMHRAGELGVQCQNVDGLGARVLQVVYNVCRYGQVTVKLNIDKAE